MSKKKPETLIQDAIFSSLSRLPWVRLYRNNVGFARGRIAYGLCKGSSDIIANVTTEVGIGRFTALEVKVPGERPTVEQIAFIESVNGMGGYACVVHDPGEALEAVMCARAGRRAA